MEESIQPPMIIRRGRWEMAHYQDLLDIPMYNIPTIRALPRIFSREDTITALAKMPAYNPKNRSARAEDRLHMIQADMLEWFEPLPIHIDLEQRLSRVIRGSLPYRNPFKPGYYGEANSKIDELETLIRMRTPTVEQRTTALGFAMIGMSGMGKTTTLERIFATYPQVILHREYERHPFPFQQLVWVHMDCPPDGSLRALCLNFITTVDDILGTTYRKTHVRRMTTADMLMPVMAMIVSNHNLGVLVVEEVQNANAATSGGSEALLNALVHLVNTIGVPIIYGGTFASWPLLTRQFRQIRRGSGQGDFIWERMDRNTEDWANLIESMWQFQYTRHHTPITSELMDVLFDECQGITDFAIKVFMLAQWRAITTGRERITSALIRSVAHDSLRSSRHVLDALRGNVTLEDLTKLGDVYPPDMSLFNTEKPVNASVPTESTIASTTGSDHAEQTLATPGRSKPKRSHGNDSLSNDSTVVPDEVPVATAERVNTGTDSDSSPAEPTLRQLAQECEKAGISLHTGLQAQDLGFASL